MVKKLIVITACSIFFTGCATTEQGQVLLKNLTNQIKSISGDRVDKTETIGKYTDSDKKGNNQVTENLSNDITYKSEKNIIKEKTSGNINQTSEVEKIYDGKGKSNWFSPAPIIKNFSKNGEKYQSDSKYILSSLSKIAHPNLGSYSGNQYDVLNGWYDSWIRKIDIENRFFKDLNQPQQHLNFKISVLDKDGLSKHGLRTPAIENQKIRMCIERDYDLGFEKLAPLDLNFDIVDGSYKFIKKMDTLSISKQESCWGLYYVNPENIFDHDNGLINFKVSFKIPELEKEFFQVFQIDTMYYGKSLTVEKVSLIAENIRPLEHPDDVKKIKVYLSELTNMSPYNSKMIKSNQDTAYDDQSNTMIQMNAETNIKNFIMYNSHTVLYKDNTLKNYKKKYENFNYSPTRGYWSYDPAITNDFINKITYQNDDGFITTKTLNLVEIKNGERLSKELKKEVTDNTINTFVKNSFLIPNYTNSVFVNKWNQMVTTLGFRSGGIILFEKDGKEIPLNVRNLYEKIKNKSINNYKNIVLVQNEEESQYRKYFDTVNKVQYRDLSNKDKSFTDEIVSLQEDLIGEDNLLDSSLYMYMSFNEYAATWGLTSKEARKLFYIDDTNRIVWKINGLRDYLSLKSPYDYSFIDVSNKGSFSNKKIKSKMPKFDNKKDIASFLAKNIDTLIKFYDNNASEKELAKLYNTKENEFLIKTLNKIPKTNPMSFEQLFIIENCERNSKGYVKKDCQDKEYWYKGRKIQPIIVKPIHDASMYLKKEINILNKALYSNDISKIDNALKNGADVNSRNNAGIKPLDFYLEYGINHTKGLTVDTTVYYYLLKNNAVPSKKSLKVFENNIERFKRNDPKSGLFGESDEVKYYRELLNSFKSIYERNSSVEVEVNKELEKITSTSKTYGEFAIKVRNLYMYNILEFNPNSREFFGNTLLNLAVMMEKDDVDFVEFLLKNGSNPDIKTNNGWPNIINAAGDNKLDTLKVLIKYGANINIKNEGSYNALNSAVLEGHINAVKILVENGININEKLGKDKINVLISATTIDKINVDIIKYLIENGADLNYVTPKGLKFIDYLNKSKANGKSELIQYLKYKNLI